MYCKSRHGVVNTSRSRLPAASKTYVLTSASFVVASSKTPQNGEFSLTSRLPRYLPTQRTGNLEVQLLETDGFDRTVLQLAALSGNVETFATVQLALDGPPVGSDVTIAA